MLELKKIVKGSIYVFSSFLIFALFIYCSKVLLARQLGPYHFGLYTLSLTVIYIFTAFSTSGIGTSITYYISKYKKKKSSFFTALFILTLVTLSISSLIIITCPSFIAFIFKSDALKPISLLIGFFIFIYGITNTLFSIIRGEEKAKAFALFRALIPILYFFLILKLTPSTAYNAIFLYIISHLIVGLFLFPYAFKKIKFSKPNFSIFKEIFSFSIVLFLVELIFQLRRWTDVWLLSILSTIKNIGYYNVAMMCASAFNLILNAMNFLYLPVSTRMFKLRKFNDLRYTYNKICFILTLIVSPLIVLLLTFPQQFILILFGKEYLPSTLPFIILISSTFINIIFGPNWTNLVVKQAKKILLLFSTTTLSLNLILNYFLIPRYGIVGAAIATATSIIIWNIITGIANWKELNAIPFSLSMLKSLFISIILIIPFWVAKFFVTLSIISAFLFAIVYLLIYIIIINYFVIKIKKIINFLFSF